MRAIDTNVLIRLITRDEPEQVRRAERFVDGNAWVSLLVLAETTWVLESVYDLSQKSIAAAVRMLLNHEALAIQDAQVAEAALTVFSAKPKLGFSDCLIVAIAKKAGHVPLGTFDKSLSRVADAKLL